MVEGKIERILQVDALEGLPVASESNVFPMIPDTDSFLLVPKNNDLGKEDDGGDENDHRHQDEGKVDGQTTVSNGGHVRRFSTGNISIPYTKVKILSRYLATSGGSCHDYCKYGARKEGEECDHEETHNTMSSSGTLRRFNDTLGKGHHDMFKQAAATLMERRRKMAISHVTPAKTTVALSTCSGSPKFDSQTAGSSRKDFTSNKRGTNSSIVSEDGVSPKPQRRNHSFSKNGTHNNPSRLGSSSSSELGVLGSPNLYPLVKRDVSPSVKSTTPLPKPATVVSEIVASPKPQNPRRSVSVPKVEGSSSANKLPILSKIFSSSSSSLAEVGIPSSSGHYSKPQRVEAFVSPFHRRGSSMSKLSISLNDVQVSKITSLGTQQRTESRRCKSHLPKSLSAREDRREQRTKKLEVSVTSTLNWGSISMSRKTVGSTRTGASEEKETISSPAKHKFLRRQSVSEPLKSPGRNPSRLNLENMKAISQSKKDQTTNNNINVKKPNEMEQLKNERVEDPISTSSIDVGEQNMINIDMEATTTTTEKRGSIIIASPTNKIEANGNHNAQSSAPSTRARNMSTGAKNHIRSSNSHPFHEKYKINLRRSRARSVISEPMARSKDCHSVVSSTESCETDLVLEQKALDRVITSRTSNRRTRRGTILSIGNRDEQPRKLHFRPGRVIEFKPEITSLPRRLKFKRRAPRSDSSQSKVEVTSGVLRKGGGRREGPPRRVEFMDTEKVVLRHQDMQGEKVLQASQNNVIEETASKLVEDRKSKVKALVGAFESLLTLQDSKPVPTISV